MLVFPQLQTGANAQYPLVRVDEMRTVSNSMADGREVRFADTGSVSTRWELRLEGLNDDEWAAVAALHRAVEGRLRTFVLLDPVSNLFQWSEDFEKPEWFKDPLLSVAGGIADPFGTVAGFRVVNGGQASQALRQTIIGDGGFQYCCSAWARSVGGSAVTVMAGSTRKTVVLDSEWIRVYAAGNGSLSAGFELAPGATVELFGPQLEAQPAPGAYWKTQARGGAYAKVRFEEDVLNLTAQDRGAETPRHGL